MCSCDYSSNIGPPQFHSTANNSIFADSDSSSRWRSSQGLIDDGVGRCSANCLSNPENPALRAISSSMRDSSSLIRTFSERPELLNGVAVVCRNLNHNDTTPNAEDHTCDGQYCPAREEAYRRSPDSGSAAYRLRRGRPPQPYAPQTLAQPPQQYLPRMTRTTAGGKCLRI